MPKNKTPDKKNWPWPARISAEGGVPGRRCSQWAAIHGCESWGLVGITQDSHAAMIVLYLGDLSKSLAIELTHLLQFWLMFMLTECPGNDLKPPCLFFPFTGQSISNPNLFHQYPPRSQTSPPLPNSFSSEDEMELVTLVSHSLWPWVVMQSGLGPSGLVYLFVTLFQRVRQVITSISVLELQESRDWISSLPSSARPAHPKPSALLFPLALMDTCSIQLEFGEKPCLPLVLSIIKKDRKKKIPTS